MYFVLKKPCPFVTSEIVDEKNEDARPFLMRKYVPADGIQ
jgi:hypothetical protein